MDFSLAVSEDTQALAFFVKLLGGWVANAFGVEGFESAPTVTALMVALGYANHLAIVFGSILAVYLYGASTLNSAMVGKVMNKQWSPVWTPLRVGAAALLIIPTHFNGGFGSVSYAQEMVVRVAMIGSQIGDEVWLDSSTALFREPPYTPTRAQYFDVPSRMFDLHMCAIGLRHGENESNNFSQPYDPNFYKDRYALTKTTKTEVPETAPNGNTTYRTVYIEDTVVNNFVGTNMSAGDLADVSRISFGDDGQCGTISLEDVLESKINPQIISALDDGRFSTAVSRNALLSGKPALATLFNNMKAFVEKVNYLSEDGNRLNDIFTEESSSGQRYKAEIQPLLDEYLAIVVQYNTDLNKSVQNSYQSEFGQKIEEGFKEAMQEGGWIYAGAYFWELHRVTRGLAEATGYYSSPDIIEYSNPSSLMCDFGWFDKFVSFVTISEPDCKAGRLIAVTREKLKKAAANSALMSDNPKYIMLKKEASVAGCGVDKCDAGTGVAAGIASDGMLELFALEDSTGMEQHQKGYLDGADPYLFIAQMGTAANTISEGMFLLKMFAAHTKPVLKKGADSAGPFGMPLAVLEGIVAGIAQAATIIMTFMAPLGFILSFVFPLIPVMHWVMIVVSWFTTVLEAIAAIPLWVVMSAMPEGEGIVGLHGQRGIALIGAILLRPALSVMGLMAAYYMGYLAFGFFNELFWKTISMQEWSLQTGIMSVIAIPLIYTTAVMSVMKFVFSIIPKFSQAILVWLTSFGSSAFGTYHEEDFSSANSAWSNLGSTLGHVQFKKRSDDNGDGKGKG